MKKSISLIFALVLSFSLCLSVVASDNNTEIENNADNKKVTLNFDNGDKIDISNVNIDGLSGYDAGVLKLQAAGINDETILNMSRQNVEIMADATEVVTQRQYFIEEETTINSRSSLQQSDDENSTMSEVTESEYFAVTPQKNRYSYNAVPAKDIKVVDENGEIIEAPPIRTPFALKTTSVDGGRLIVDVYFLNVGGNGMAYGVITEYVWQYMPNKRGTDFIGLMHQGQAVPLKNTFDGHKWYDVDNVMYLATSSGHIAESPMGASYFDAPLYNEVSLLEGAAATINMPSDNPPPPMMNVGTSLVASFCYGERGYVSYIVELSNVTASGVVLHGAQYAHQSRGTVMVTPSVNVSSTGLSLDIEASYQKNYTSFFVEENMRYTVSYT